MGFVNDGPWANFETEAPDTLENGSVGTNQLVDGSITTQKFADGSITSAKIANGAVTSEKLATSLLDDIESRGIESKMHYLFRTSVEALPTTISNNVPQGMCITNSNVGYFALAPASTNTDTTARIYRIDMGTKTVVSSTDGALGHCNSMAFDDEKNLLYVAPNQMGGVSTNALLICDPDTLDILRSVDMPVQGRIMYDKITKKLYLGGSSTLYLIDRDSYAATKIADIDLSTISYSLTSNNNFLLNGMCVYNDSIYLTSGYSKVNLVVQLNLSGDVKRVLQPSSHCYLFNIDEYQDCDVTSDGVLIIYSTGFIGANKYGVVGGVSINGRTRFPETNILSNDPTVVLNTTYDANGVGGSANVPITSLGSSAAPMLTIAEAQRATELRMQSNNQFISLIGFVYTSKMLTSGDLYLKCTTATDSGIVIDSDIHIVNLIIDCYSSGVNHCFVRKAATGSGSPLQTNAARFRNVTFDFTEDATSLAVINNRGIVNIGSGCKINKGSLSGNFFYLEQFAGLVSCNTSVANAYPDFLTVTGAKPTILGTVQ